MPAMATPITPAAAARRHSPCRALTARRWNASQIATSEATTAIRTESATTRTSQRAMASMRIAAMPM